MFRMYNRICHGLFISLSWCDQVMKKVGTLRVPSMSCKAFNGRVVLEYLASVARLAASSAVATGPRRTFGVWLNAEVRAGRRTYPSDPKIPVQAVALKLVDTFPEFLDTIQTKITPFWILSNLASAFPGRPWHDGLD